MRSLVQPPQLFTAMMKTTAAIHGAIMSLGKPINVLWQKANPSRNASLLDTIVTEGATVSNWGNQIVDKQISLLNQILG